MKRLDIFRTLIRHDARIGMLALGKITEVISLRKRCLFLPSSPHATRLFRAQLRYVWRPKFAAIREASSQKSSALPKQVNGKIFFSEWLCIYMLRAYFTHRIV